MKEREKKIHPEEIMIFFFPEACVGSEVPRRRKVRYDRNTKVNWRDGRENGFREDGNECTQETAGEVVTEMEKRVVEERRGRNKEDEKSGSIGVDSSRLPFSLLTRISVRRVILSALCTLNKRGRLLLAFKRE